jgi:tetratricopeptide (TPR) repeat protein
MSNKVSDHLFVLIKSLSKPEKRYFKLFSSRHMSKAKNTYQLVFDAIDKQDEYDEEAIVAKYKNHAFTNRFSITKNRLYTAIMRSLDAYHSNSSVDAELRRLLHAAEILYKKSLYDQSFKMLMSAKRLAYKYERNTILIEVLNWEKMLIEKDNYEGVNAAGIDKILKEDRRIAKLIEVYNEFWNVKSHLFNVLFRKGKARSQEDIEKFKKLIDHTLLHREEDELFTQTKYLYYHIYSAFYFGTGDYKSCYDFLQKNITLIETNYPLFQEEPNTYVSVLTNAIFVGMQLKKFDEAFAYLKKLRTVPEQLVISSNENLDIRLFNSAYSIELALYAITGEFDKGLRIVKAVEEGLKKYRQKMSSVRKASFYFSIAILYFGAGKHSEALRWVNELLNNIHVDESEDIHCFAQLLNLVIHLELGNKNLIPYTLKSTSRYLETRNRVYKFESAMLQFVSNALKVEYEEDMEDVYKKLVDELKPLRTDTFESTAFENFDFITWAESKVQQKPFAELVQERAKMPV